MASYQQLSDDLGLDLEPVQLEQLERYERFLRDEAMAAGGIGPDETTRLFDRHVGDSLAYLTVLPDTDSVVDVGSGVGLPGIPIAIARPDTEVELLDRAGRRVDLARRAVRISGARNVAVTLGDVHSRTRPASVLVFRASLPPEAAARVAGDLLAPGGTALVGLSRLPEPPAVPSPLADLDYAVVDASRGALASPSWILVITKRTESENAG